MQINLRIKWLLLFPLLSTYFLTTYAGRGGGGRGGSRGSYSRPSYSRPAPSYPSPSPSYSRPAPSYPSPSPSYSRPAPAPAPKPAPAPAPKPAPAPPPKPTPSPAAKSAPSPTPKSIPTPASTPNPASRPGLEPPTVSKPDVVQQPAYNPNYQPNTQPAYNPNFKPDNSKPLGPPPPYSPNNHPVPNAPIGPPPAYQGNGKPPTGAQVPPYPGPAVRPPGYPGQSPNPVQPGRMPPNQQDVNRPYPVQPGYQGGFHQPNVNRPYPVQPGIYPGINRPQSLGGNVWQPHYGIPAPAYMNYGGIPTGTNMYTKPHKKKGFIGSLMSMSKSDKKNKYYGSYPSPYGIRNVGSIGANSIGGGFLGTHGSSASMYTIFPYMAAKSGQIHNTRFRIMPVYVPSWYHHHHYHFSYSREVYPDHIKYFDVYNDDYLGECQKPIKKKHSEIKCNATFDVLECNAKCEKGYNFSHRIEQVRNKCWHITGVWRPQKNFPDCKPVCNAECQNGGECIRPDVCKCPAKFRGDQCQFSFLKCDIRSLVKRQKVGWVCAHHRNETVCKIRCKEPEQFDSPPATQYHCTPEGVWTPGTVPQCVVKDTPDGKNITVNP